jgi:hypothetical protein
MPKSAEVEARERRLAEKLRENLKRRKRQAKARSGSGKATGGGPPAAPGEGGERG